MWPPTPPGAAIPVDTSRGGIAIAPDGQTAYVGGGPEGAGAVTQVDTATNSVEVGATIEGAGDPESIVVTPDQAPNAGFSASAAPAGEPSTLDASSSSSPVGSIARYAWDFGDGQTEATTTPSTRHVYAQPGTYDVRLTVTNTAGTSLTQVYTGQTVSREGGPAATTSHPVTVPPRARFPSRRSSTCASFMCV